MPSDEGQSKHPKIRFSEPPNRIGASSSKPEPIPTVDALDDEEIVLGGDGAESGSTPVPVSDEGGEAISEGFAAGDGDDAPADMPSGVLPSKKIRAFERHRSEGPEWKRKPLQTGEGACHVKTFHSKISEDSLAYVDRQINEWLEQNPEYEVKFVSTAIGMFTGKVKEPHLICMVWV
jgi:hypothetical protein